MVEEYSYIEAVSCAINLLLNGATRGRTATNRRGFSVVKLLPITELRFDSSPYNATSSAALESMLLRLSPGVVPSLSGMLST